MIRPAKQLLRNFVFAADGAAFVTRFNFFNKVYWHLPVTLAWDAQRSNYLVSDSEATLAFARKERVWVYSKGVVGRLNALARMYLVNQVPLSAQDTVVDCGANIGEFSCCIRELFGCRVIAVEPEASEAKCIASNVPGISAVVNGALWKEDGFIDLFSKNDSADSSIFEVEGYANKTRVRTVTLDSLLREHSVERVALLKLEAEGAEPEILDGARECLERIDFIAADLGPERGVRRETTLAPVANRLLGHGFELVDVYAPRLICLFRNARVSRAVS